MKNQSDPTALLIPPHFLVVPCLILVVRKRTTRTRTTIPAAILVVKVKVIVKVFL
jgi:hypothetical protein